MFENDEKIKLPDLEFLSTLNSQQKNAVLNTEGPLLVLSGAGTGKTKVLTDRVLSLLLNGTPPGKILCLTFTRAAAAEMANRINEALSTWAISDDLSLSRALTMLRGIPPDKKLLPKARRLFRSVLETHGGMKIQTIHSFCESLLGRFPLEAGLAPYFSTLDEAETLEALKEARTRVFLNPSNENSSVTQAINYLCKFLDGACLFHKLYL